MNISKNNSANKEYINMVVEILHTGNWLDNKISKILATFGITHVQFNILRILEGANSDPLSVGEVKKRVLFSKCDITRLLDRLKDKELVEREINPINRRRMDVSITQKGLDLIKSILPKIEEELEGFYAEKLSLEERDIIIKSLKKLRTE